MSAPASRFAFIDALRGVAAAMVALGHFYASLPKGADPHVWPEPVHSALSVGHTGVYIFFVLSGFVIAHSIRGAHVTPRYVGRFALRRSLRLDPPYWLALVLYLGLARVMGVRTYESLDAAGYLANIVYLHELLDYKAVMAVAWTLCLELQFYLVFVVTTAISQALARANAALREVPFVLLFLLSLAAGSGQLYPLPSGPDALFITLWWCFYLGVLGQRVASGTARSIVLYAAAALCVPAAWLRGEPELLVAAATTLTIHIVARRGALGTLWSGRVVQHLGKISYSLYLLHPLVGNRVIRFVIARVEEPTLALELGLFVGASVASVVAATAFWWAVERPTLELARRYVQLERAPEPGAPRAA